MMIFILLCLSLSICSGASRSFHDKMTPSELVHYFGTPHLHKVPEYDVISPIRKVHKRSRRNTLEYHVTALGENYDLILQRNPDLLPANCLIHRHNNGTKLVEPCSLGGDDCYYFGTSVSHNQSRVAVSTCLGLNGVIITGDHELYLQPIRTEHRSRVRRDVENPHIAYRKNIKRRNKGTAPEDVYYKLEPDVRAHRRRRSVKRTAELMVVTDGEMLKYHGDDTKRYVMTAINIAAQRLLDATLHEEIHLAVVKLSMLSEDQTDLDVTPDAQYTLNKFCEWQTKINPVGDTQPQHADASVLITRLDIENLGNGDATGLAFVHGMCRHDKCCSYNQDTGLDLGLTIAHELGHTMGMRHDGIGNSCENGKYIMSSDGGTGSQGLEWSECSVKALKEFLLTEQAQCLADEPVVREVKAVHQKPGLIYDVDEQCRQSYGEGSSKCEGSSLVIQGDECARLVCFDPRLPGKCTGSTAPRMDGTECGKGKWCIKGRCVPYGKDGPTSVDGGWSAWDETWSACSRTCGGGVKLKRRHCHNPKPAFGGKQCVGKAIQAKICNVHKCKKPEHSFKAEQCAATNNIKIYGQTYSWLPYDKATGDAQCVMDCKAEGERIVQRRGNQFRDGTFCAGQGTSTFYRCVDAKCRAFGCDGVLDSGKMFDKCGKCNGNSDTCRKISGTFRKGEKQKYVTFVTIPSEATGILIINNNTKTTLSIKVEGKRLFNEDGKKGVGGRFTEGDVSVVYTPQGKETVKIDGPLSNEIEAQVWREYSDKEYYNVSPDIYYEYHLPHTADDDPVEYSWATQPIKCSKSCGGGRLQLSVSCARNDDKMKVDNSYCDIRQQPNEYGAICNDQACPPSWQAGSYGKCSKSCGGGLMTRTVRCVRLQTDGYKGVDASECSGVGKPPEQFTCNRKSCPGVWVPGSWSACSLTCGRGQQSRDVQCQRDKVTGKKQDDSECISTEKPALVKQCMVKTCKSTRSGSTCSDTEDCSVYDVGACKNFREFMERNCSRFCGFCTINKGLETGPQTEKTKGGSCEDKTDCSQYQGNFCVDPQYKAWSEINCRKTCKICSDAQSTCADAEPDCATAYGDNVCTEYAEWSKINCKSYCGFCSGANQARVSTSSTDSTCVDVETNCATAYGDNVCTEYAEWSKIKCKSYCGLCSGANQARVSTSSTDSTCVDAETDCATAYGDNICTEYAEWSKIHCKKHCNFCSKENKTKGCTDKAECDAYEGDVCRDYKDWAQHNCRNYCGFCAEGRSKRSAAVSPIARPPIKDFPGPGFGTMESSMRSPHKKVPTPRQVNNFVSPRRRQSKPVPPAARTNIFDDSKKLDPFPHVSQKKYVSPIRQAKRKALTEPRKHSATDVVSETISSSKLAQVDTCGSLVTSSSLRINTLGKVLEGQTCVFAISRPLSEKIVLHFEKIHIDCRKGDDLSVEDGVSGVAIHLCQKASNYTYVTESNNALLKLTAGQKGSGYLLTYTSKKWDQTYSACSEQLNGQSGEIVSPKRSLSYFPGQTCEVFVNVKPDRLIRLHFSRFNIGDTGNCTESFLKITDISSLRTDTFCGFKPGLVWESTGSRVKIEYALDATIRGRGFTASYIAI